MKASDERLIKDITNQISARVLKNLNDGLDLLRLGGISTTDVSTMMAYFAVVTSVSSELLLVTAGIYQRLSGGKAGGGATQIEDEDLGEALGYIVTHALAKVGFLAPESAKLIGPFKDAIVPIIKKFKADLEAQKH